MSTYKKAHNMWLSRLPPNKRTAMFSGGKMLTSIADASLSKAACMLRKLRRVNEMSEYADRDIEAQGETYVKHVSAMTGEDLHFKSDIAAELAHRDIEIQRLQGEVKRYRLALAKLCQLKAIKDKHGKTEQYRLCQPTAWDNAFRLLQEKDGE